MKNITKILGVLFLVITFSCDDQLERLPNDNLVEETAFQTVSDLQAGMVGFFGNYNPSLLIGFNSNFTDNAKIGRNNGGQELNTLNQILTPDGGDRGLWTNRYGTINLINRLLVAAESITPGAGEEDDYNLVLAQSYAFRAISHYDVLLYYGFDITDNASLGVPFVDYVSTSAQPNRNTTGEVLAAIEADLVLASALLPAGFSDINFATQDFIRFLRARIALESQNYQVCIALCNNLIGSYPLADFGQYFAMFNEDADVTEVIFKYDNVQGFNYNIAGNWRFTGGTGDNGFVEMSDELEGLFLDMDIRRPVNIDPFSLIDDGEYLIGKYPPNADTNYINDAKAMRISEIYLIRAEAYARTGSFNMAATDVNSISNARTGAGSEVYSNLNQALTGILAERRLELAYDGHRYNDLKRMRFDLNSGIERDESDCMGSIPCSMPITSEKWIFPIPTSEVNANPNIVQAPNY